MLQKISTASLVLQYHHKPSHHVLPLLSNLAFPAHWGAQKPPSIVFQQHHNPSHSPNSEIASCRFSCNHPFALCCTTKAHPTYRTPLILCFNLQSPTHFMFHEYHNNSLPQFLIASRRLGCSESRCVQRAHRMAGREPIDLRKEIY